ncbi:50S ribosomal protein L18 [Desulfobotulus sp. H1]|uniref:Large ribosomal subunit protein uL18 n=1 Tax=Desulfobotulus pelophilus TaxID=2823377 RepID=A0ABT3N4R2_9BACT|nr:50S ribosomal protein L18 [Desulfobotulus pelophilus]MCW7752452.1 50S ribosomal protein L18 [Desulfobotulus pelophilus]
MSSNSKKATRLKRKIRIRKKVRGSTARPRLCVFRSARHIYAQIIDDIEGRTLFSASSAEKDILSSEESAGVKLEQAKAIGKKVAERAVAGGVSQVVFDRNGFIYHGRVKAVADGAREAGLEF